MNKLDSNYDVIVVGAGPAGCVAAIQAARAGAKTLLIEKNGIAGGNITVCGVNFPGLFHAWGNQVIAGIGWELVTKAVKECGETLPDFSKYADVPHWHLQIKINPFIYACILDEAFKASGVQVLYHAMPMDVKENDDCVSMSIASKEGLHEINCKIAIDTSGDAELVTKAGYQVNKSEEKQPGTPMIRLGGYNVEKLDFPNIEAAYKKAVDTGELNYLDYMSRPIESLIRNHGENCIHVVADNASTSTERSDVEQRARELVLKIYRFLKKQPGLEKLQLEYLASQCGIRETAIIVGEKTITAEDYVTGKKWNDSLCYSFYPIDLHQRDDHNGIHQSFLTEGTIPTVPRGALIPKGSKRLLAAGRMVSSDRLANSALRVQASCMAMGQVTGALAALAITNNQSSADLEINTIKQLLTKHNAIFPE